MTINICGLGVALAALVTTIGCEAGALLSDRMEGCYSDGPGKPADVKITKSAGTYYVRLQERSSWSDSTELRQGTSDEIKIVFDGDSAAVVESLVAKNGPFGLFRLRRDARIKGTDSTTDYVVFLLLGATSVFRAKCE